MSRVSIIIPGISGPLPEITTIENDKSVRRFIKQISRNGVDRTYKQDYFDLTAIFFGLQTEPLPIARFFLEAFGIDSGSHHWICADPVHLMADVDHAILYDQKSLKLTEEESSSLIETINRHLVDDGLELIVGDSEHWFLKSDKPFGIETTRLDDVVMRNVNRHVPRGEASSRLRRINSEIQMLLYEHEINLARADRGELTVNSLWMWGEGELSASRSGLIDVAIGDNLLLEGMAKICNVPYIKYSDSSDIFSSLRDKENVLIVFDELRSAMNYGDIGLWQTEFNRLYDARLAGLLDQLVTSGYGYDIYNCQGKRYSFDRSDRIAFWRRLSIGDHFETVDH